MQIQILTKQLELGAETRFSIEEKVLTLTRFVKSMEKHGEIYARIEVAKTTKHHKSGRIFYAEGNLHINGNILRAESYENTVDAAIDGLKDKLKSEILRYKEKYIGTKIHKRRHQKDII